MKQLEGRESSQKAKETHTYNTQMPNYQIIFQSTGLPTIKLQAAGSLFQSFKSSSNTAKNTKYFPKNNFRIYKIYIIFQQQISFQTTKKTYFHMFRHVLIILFLIFKTTITGITKMMKNWFLFLQRKTKHYQGFSEKKIFNLYL